MEKTQPIQNSQYSQYARGVATGAVAAGTLAAGALAIHSYVHSGTKIPVAMSTAASTLKEISTGFASGVLSSFTTVFSCASLMSKMGVAFISNGSYATKIDFTQIKDHWIYKGEAALAVFALISGVSGCTTLGISRLFTRLF